MRVITWIQTLLSIETMDALGKIDSKEMLKIENPLSFESRKIIFAYVLNKISKSTISVTFWVENAKDGGSFIEVELG